MVRPGPTYVRSRAGPGLGQEVLARIVPGGYEILRTSSTFVLYNLSIGPRVRITDGKYWLKVIGKISGVHSDIIIQNVEDNHGPHNIAHRLVQAYPFTCMALSGPCTPWAGPVWPTVCHGPT